MKKTVAIYNCILTHGSRGHTRIVMNTLIQEANECTYQIEKIYGTDIEYRNYQDVGEFQPDNLDRPGLHRLLEDVENGRIDAIVMVVLTKLSNDINLVLDFYQKCKEHNVELITATDGRRVMQVLDQALENRRDL